MGQRSSQWVGGHRRGALTGFGELKNYDGPWQREEDLEHKSVWGKYLLPTTFGEVSVTVSGYNADWRPTEQITERMTGSSVCTGPFCSLDPTATGHTSRWIGGAQFEDPDWSAAAYPQYYEWYMQSNPTYDFQISQFDRRFTTGGRYDHFLTEVSDVELRIGAELRYDDIGRVGLDQDDAGSFVENISDNDIRETPAGAYVEATYPPIPRLRLVGGFRGDYYDFDVRALSTGGFAGSETDTRISPKLGVACVVHDHAELYANWGGGFHSNDARGVVNSSDPVPGLSPGTGHEAGARGDVRVTAACWWLDLASELIFVGDSNSVEPKGASEREGYELTAFWQPRCGSGSTRCTPPAIRVTSTIRTDRLSSRRWSPRASWAWQPSRTAGRRACGCATSGPTR